MLMRNTDVADEVEIASSPVAAHNPSTMLPHKARIRFTSETCFVLFGAQGHFRNMFKTFGQMGRAF